MYVHKPQHTSSRSPRFLPSRRLVYSTSFWVPPCHESWADWDTPKQITSSPAKFEEAKQWFNASGRIGRPQFALIYVDDQGATRVIKDFSNPEIESHVGDALREIKFISPFPQAGMTILSSPQVWD
jgi:hypothetical protein